MLYKFLLCTFKAFGFSEFFPEEVKGLLVNAFSQDRASKETEIVLGVTERDGGKNTCPHKSDHKNRRAYIVHETFSEDIS